MVGMPAQRLQRAMTGRAHWPLRDADRAVFDTLDRPARQLVLRLLGFGGMPTEADFDALKQHPQGTALASWLMTLPAYANAPEYDDERAEGIDPYQIDVRYEADHEAPMMENGRPMLAWQRHAVHGYGWLLSYLDDPTSETAGVDEYFIPGDLTDVDAAIRSAREWLRRVYGEASQ